MNTGPDYLISICFTTERSIADDLVALARLAEQCARSMKYWEILYVIDEASRNEVKSEAARISRIRNLRILPVRGSVSYYRRRMIAASEAIGDVVILTSFREFEHVDLTKFAQMAMQTGNVELGYSVGPHGFQGLSRMLIGAISSYKVDGSTLKTIALPRNQLVSLLARPSAALDLRFEPKASVTPYERVEIAMPRSASDVSLTERVELLLEIFKSSAPRYLASFATLAAIGAAFALVYGFYAVGVYLFKEKIQPGWFTAAIMQSASISFLLFGLAIISLGLASIYERFTGANALELADEIGNITFYENNNELNVEVRKRQNRESDS